jgi:hypothetical protein
MEIMAQEKEKIQELSDNAKEAEKLIKQLSEDKKLAAEAMRRTVIYRRTIVVRPVHHIYRQIF